VNEEAGTPVDQMSRGFQPTTDPQLAAPVAPREARRVPKARREHSKGNGNFPAPEPRADKGNVTARQDDRNPNLETRDDQRPGPPSRAFSLDAARDAAAMPNAAPRPRPIAEAKRAGSNAGRTPSMPKPKSRTVAKRAGSRPRAQERSRAASTRSAAKRPKAKRATTKRSAPKRSAVKRSAPRKRTAAKRTAAKRPASRAKQKR
jgi:hypothetical protein